jgi:hypothetical protein
MRGGGQDRRQIDRYVPSCPLDDIATGALDARDPRLGRACRQAAEQ